MIRILVTGAGGMLGRELVRAGAEADVQIVGRVRAELDIADPAAVARALAADAPDVVVNAAGYTQVDRAETEVQEARRGNVEGPARLADQCARRSIPLLHVSTDYVFDGSSRRPYRPDDQANPIGVYGRTKWEGEEAIRAVGSRHVIVRTSWLYAAHGRNFVRTVVQLARERDELAIVADQRGSPTRAGDLATALLLAAEHAAQDRAAWGTHHFCNAGETTRFELAATIVQELAGRPGVVCRVVRPITTAEYLTPAARPAYSTLDTASWTAGFGLAPRPWREALQQTLCELT